MSTIVTRAGKGSPLTWNEADNNFTNLNTDKLQSGNTAAALTITSATITGGALNGSLGATTPSTVVATDLTTTGNTILGNASTDTLNVGNGGLVKDASGNVGIGVTPSAWGSGRTTLEIGGSATGAISFTGSGKDGLILLNAVRDATAWKYVNTGYASIAEQYNGQHIWYTAPSGTAGNPITFTQAMTLDANSKLTVAGEASIHGITVGLGGGSVATNTAVGGTALASNVSGVSVTAVGQNALYANTGSYNTGIGQGAMYFNTTGTHNVALGTPALLNNTTGSYNTGIGDQALYNNTTASYNTAVGYQAGYSNTTAPAFTALGYRAGFANTTGTSNTFLGMQTGEATTTGRENVFVGAGSGTTNTTGSYNVYMGAGIGGAQYPSGYYATGSYNTFIGAPAGSSITTGSKNTILGGYTGNQGGLDIRTANNYIVLSDGDGNPRAYWSDQGNATFTWGTATRTIFNNTSATAGNCYGLNINYLGASPNGTSNHFILASDSTTDRMAVRSNGGIANYSANNVNLSDERTKKDIADAGNYLDKICAIPVRTFLYKDQTDSELNLGVIAQEVEAVAPELIDVSGFGETPEDGVPLKAVYQTDLVYALMKSIQELSTKVTALEAQLGAK